MPPSARHRGPLKNVCVWKQPRVCAPANPAMAAVTLSKLKQHVEALIETRDLMPTKLCVTTVTTSAKSAADAHSAMAAWSQIDSGKSMEYHVSLTYSDTLKATSVLEDVAKTLHSALIKAGGGKLEIGALQHSQDALHVHIAIQFEDNYSKDNDARSLDAIASALHTGNAVNVIFWENGIIDTVNPQLRSADLLLALSKAAMSTTYFRRDNTAASIVLTLLEPKADDFGSLRAREKSVEIDITPDRIVRKKRQIS